MRHLSVRHAVIVYQSLVCETHSDCVRRICLCRRLLVLIVLFMCWLSPSCFGRAVVVFVVLFLWA